MPQFVLAKVIEHDNQNIAHCKQQLKNDQWERNVVMLYVKDSQGTNKFRALYEQVSTEHPDRHLFALNVLNPNADAKDNLLIRKTVKACLTNMMSGGERAMGDINSKTPALLLYDYSIAKNFDEKGRGLPIVSTKEDILYFIQENP